MAKEKFERNKPHINIGTIGHVDHGKTLLLLLSLRFLTSKAMQISLTTLTSTALQKRELVVSQLTQHTLSMKQTSVTTLMLTAQDMLTTLRT